MFSVLDATVYTDSSSIGAEISVVLGPKGIIKSILSFILARRKKKSLRRQEEACFALVLFMRYMIANPYESDKALLFLNFNERLLIGSFDLASGEDLSGLGWSPRSDVEVRSILGYVSDFLDHVDQKGAGKEEWFGIKADHFDWMCDKAAFVKKRDVGLLGHLLPYQDSEGKRRYFDRTPIVRVAQKSPPMFPRERFLDFLLKGFIVGGRQNYRDVLITLLLYGAGFRESEPMHLFIEDVVPNPLNPKQAVVRIHHPTLGLAPISALRKHGLQREMSRQEYLNKVFGLQPRNLLRGRQHAGWKGGLLDAKHYKDAQWFPEDWGELFWKYWQLYMKQIATIPRSHPYAFINLSGETKGEPYSIEQYCRSFKRAARRVGLEPGRENGVHPHGLRHGYAGELKDAEVPALVIQLCMHHADIQSQERYGQPSATDITEELRKGKSRLDSKREKESKK